MGYKGVEEDAFPNVTTCPPIIILFCTIMKLVFLVLWFE
jgi:hypothetical protein